MSQALLDACYTDNLLSIGLYLMFKFRAEMESTFGEVISPAIDLMQDRWALSSFSSHLITETCRRAFLWQSAAVTTNKAGLRRKLLNKFSVHPKTRQRLTYSSFTSDNVFGRLPECFLERTPSSTTVTHGGEGQAPQRKPWKRQKTEEDQRLQLPRTKKSKFGEILAFDSSSVFSEKPPTPGVGGGGGVRIGERERVGVQEPDPRTNVVEVPSFPPSSRGKPRGPSGHLNYDHGSQVGLSHPSTSFFFPLPSSSYQRSECFANSSLSTGLAPRVRDKGNRGPSLRRPSLFFRDVCGGEGRRFSPLHHHFEDPHSVSSGSFI